MSHLSYTPHRKLLTEISANTLSTSTSIGGDPGIVDTGNSTTSTLTATSVYTGTYLDVTNYSQFSVIYLADVIGTLRMDLSMDGITAHRTKTVEDVSGGVHTLAIVSKYMRVRWTNGATNQSSFSLQTIFHKNKSKELTSTMNQNVSNANDVSLVRDATIAEWDTAREFFSGRTTEHFIGENNAVTTTWTDIYPNGTHNYPFPTSAQALEILSSDANDSGISTGILTLAANASDGDTFTIGSRVYTLQSTLTDVDGNIHIDSTAAATILNIVDAIILGSGGEGVGTGYATSMTVNTNVSAADGTGDTIDFVSLPAYYLANDGDLEVLATTETGAQLSFGAVEMVHPLGAHTIEIHGLNASGMDSEEIIHMNGTTPVDLANSYIRINNIHLQAVGTQQGGNYGDITLRIDGGGDTLSQIQGFESVGNPTYGHGEDNSGIWSIPANRIAYLTAIEVSVDSSKTANVMLYEAEGALRNTSSFLPRRVLWQAFNIAGDISHDFRSFVKIKPLTDLFFRAVLSTGTGGVSVRLSWYQAVPNADNK